MALLNFAIDEGILLEESDGIWVDANNKELNQLILTNKYIYVVYYQQEGGRRSQPVEYIQKLDLSDIKIIKGKPMVDQVKNETYRWALQVQTVKAIHQFTFKNWSKRKVPDWKNKIFEILIDSESLNNQKKIIESTPAQAKRSDVASNVKDKAGGVFKAFSSVVKQVADSAAEAIENSQEKKQEEADTHAQVLLNQMNVQPGTASPQPASQPMSKFCTSCGAKLIPGNKFCGNCGAPTGIESNNTNQAIPPIPGAHSSSPLSSMENPTARHQEFAGIMIKCPNCGASINQTTAVCPECGHYMTGRAAVSSVQRFSDQLLVLEAHRKKDGLLDMLNSKVNPTDMQKLTLIRSFPVPNTIDDIQEFMLLASSNINVELSKRGFSLFGPSTTPTTEVTSSNIERVISDAWVAKMQQIYQKAEIVFPNEPAFAYVQQLYLDKMKELKIKVNVEKK